MGHRLQNEQYKPGRVLPAGISNGVAESFICEPKADGCKGCYYEQGHCFGYDNHCDKIIYVKATKQTRWTPVGGMPATPKFKKYREVNHV